LEQVYIQRYEGRDTETRSGWLIRELAGASGPIGREDAPPSAGDYYAMDTPARAGKRVRLEEEWDEGTDK